MPSTNTSRKPMIGADCPALPELIGVLQLSHTATVARDLLVSEMPVDVWYSNMPVVGSGPSQVSAGLPIISPTPCLVGLTMLPVSMGIESPHRTTVGLAPLAAFRQLDQTSR